MLNSLFIDASLTLALRSNDPSLRSMSFKFNFSAPSSGENPCDKGEQATCRADIDLLEAKELDLNEVGNSTRKSCKLLSLGCSTPLRWPFY